MRFEVLLADDASRDLEDIYTYVAEHDAPGKATDSLNCIEVDSSVGESLVIRHPPVKPCALSVSQRELRPVGTNARPNFLD